MKNNILTSLIVIASIVSVSSTNVEASKLSEIKSVKSSYSSKINWVRNHPNGFTTPAWKRVSILEKKRDLEIKDINSKWWRIAKKAKAKAKSIRIKKAQKAKARSIAKAKKDKAVARVELEKAKAIAVSREVGKLNKELSNISRKLEKVIYKDRINTIKGLKELSERCGKYGDKIRFKNLPNGYQYCYLKMDDYVSFLEAKTTSANTATGGK